MDCLACMRTVEETSRGRVREVADLPQSRPPIRRMLYIHEQLKRGGMPNCRKLGEEMEVSWRTVHRDIQFMQEQLRLPIEYEPRQRGYYYTRPVEHFPGVTVSEAELFALLVAQKTVAQYGGTPFARPLQAAFEKLTSDLDQEAVFHVLDLGDTILLRLPGTEEPDEEDFQIVLRAVQQCRPLRFRYRKFATQEIAERSLHPYQLVCAHQRWYVVGWDPWRGALRTFVLARMQELEIDDGTFERPAGFRIEDHLRGSFGIFKTEGDAEVEVEVALDCWAADVLRGRRWHSSQQVEELPGGAMRITFRLSGLEEIESWVLSWGGHATVLRPQALADRVVAAARAVQARYQAPRCGEPDHEEQPAQPPGVGDPESGP